MALRRRSPHGLGDWDYRGPRESAISDTANVHHDFEDVARSQACDGGQAEGGQQAGRRKVLQCKEVPLAMWHGISPADVGR